MTNWWETSNFKRTAIHHLLLTPRTYSKYKWTGVALWAKNHLCSWKPLSFQTLLSHRWFCLEIISCLHLFFRLCPTCGCRRVNYCSVTNDPVISLYRLSILWTMITTGAASMVNGILTLEIPDRTAWNQGERSLTFLSPKTLSYHLQWNFSYAIPCLNLHGRINKVKVKLLCMVLRWQKRYSFSKIVGKRNRESKTLQPLLQIQIVLTYVCSFVPPRKIKKIPS